MQLTFSESDSLENALCLRKDQTQKEQQMHLKSTACYLQFVQGDHWKNLIRIEHLSADRSIPFKCVFEE